MMILSTALKKRASIYPAFAILFMRKLFIDNFLFTECGAEDSSLIISNLLRQKVEHAEIFRAYNVCKIKDILQEHFGEINQVLNKLLFLIISCFS